ncbi:MAG: Sensor protein ZraS [candidate division TA06 bacterium ADurb.Bin417]|uniref:histidine kinase n=1 Tax=candidate division TA06 bacterium ADurb.Bin417 TaxID=1852828 RepID=A0A1V5MHB5_UNCT6|nr:MAG: Sensor protein ZraS [candidate division TA06 bacterium ADurb.Bin417]
MALFLEESGQFRFQSGTGWDPEISGQLDFDLANPLIRRLTSERQLVARWEIDRLPVPASEAEAIRRELSLLQAWLCVPLFSQGRVNGFIALGNKVRGSGFTETELDLAVFLASHLGLMVENVRLYHRIARSKKEQEMIFRDLAAGVIAADREGRIFTFNDRASEMLRLAKDEMVGQDIQRAGSQLADLFWRVLRETDAEHEKRLVYQPTGTPLQVHARLMHDDNERVEGAVIVLLDLTEKERLETKVRELERLNYWYQLAGSMAHQIKNPLVSIKTFVQLFPEKYQDPEFRDNFFKIVNREVERLNGIIAELFEFSEPGELHLKPCPLNEILADVIRKAETEGGPRISPPAESEETVWVNADRDRLIKAFGCLMDNAREAIRKGRNGQIEIRTLPARLESGPALRIEFRDNGSGLVPGQVEEVFSPFYTTKTKGMGLGLPICRRIVQEHGGSIEIESRPGHGTTCRVTLPVLTGRG